MLSIIIVNYKTTQLVLDCIASVYENTHSTPFEIIVVDNSNDGICKLTVEEKYKKVKVLEAGYNAGFARANNIGIRKAIGELILLLNSDTIVKPAALDICVELFQKDVDAAACGVQLLNYDGSHQMSGANFYKGDVNYFLRLPYLIHFYLKIKEKLKKTEPVVKSQKKQVDWINGAFLMVKQKYIDLAGVMDEEFFLYAEEAEWCSRIGKFGKMYLYSEAEVIHLQGVTSAAAYSTNKPGYFYIFDKRGLQLLVSEFLRIKKQSGPFWLLVHYFAFVLYTPFFFIFLCFDFLLHQKQRIYTFSDMKGYISNIALSAKYILRMLLGNKFFYKVM